jgi:hypothetical protein
MSLKDVSVFNKCLYRSILEIYTGYDTFTFTIDSRTKNRIIGITSMTVSGTSLTADLGFPYATPITKMFDSDLVSNIAIALASPFTLEWNTVDWTMPDNTLSVVDQFPIDIIKTLAEVCGAVVLTTPDNILKVYPKYPINPSEWDDSTAELIISDDTDIISQNEVDEIRSGHNKIRLFNHNIVENESVAIEEVSIDTITNEEETETTINTYDDRKKLHVFSVPFNSSLILQTSGGNEVSIKDEGVVSESLTELIEFINGTSKTSKPIYSISYYSWKQKSLGTLTFREDGQVSSSVNEHSLLEITYSTKYLQFEVQDPEIEKVQFYVE